MSAPTSMPASTPICKHGNRYYCGLCSTERSTKCEHGNAHYCGFCLAEKGDGRVPGGVDGAVR